MKYTREQVMGMNAEALDACMAEVRAHQDDADIDVAGVTELVDWIADRRAQLRNEAEQRAALRRRIAGGEGTMTGNRSFADNSGERRYTIDSPEYRSGLLKGLLDQELTEEERSAVSYVATTGDNTYGAQNVLPSQMLNKIWDLIDEQHPILNDITMYHTGTILEIAKRTAISQGDAASVNENAANDDEVNTFVKVTLSGKDFAKHVDISYAMAKMSIDAFEAFLTREIADRLGAALANDVLTQVATDAAVGNALTTTGTKVLTFAEVATAMSMLKNAMGGAVVYGRRESIYKYLVGMVDSTNRPIFQLNAQNGAEGTLIGCPVKVEDSVPADVLWIGYPQQIVGNMIQDIMVESDKDIKKHVITYSGYARFECKLLAPNAFAKVTIKQS